MKRTLLLLLTTSIVAVLMYGCSGSEQTAEAPVEEDLAASVNDWNIHQGVPLQLHRPAPRGPAP